LFLCSFSVLGALRIFPPFPFHFHFPVQHAKIRGLSNCERQEAEDLKFFNLFSGAWTLLPLLSDDLHLQCGWHGLIHGQKFIIYKKIIMFDIK